MSRSARRAGRGSVVGVSDPAVLAAVEELVEELNEIVRPDGAALRITASTPVALALELDLSASECPECVVPKMLLLEIVSSRVAETCPEVRAITLDDPREHETFEEHPTKGEQR